MTHGEQRSRAIGIGPVRWDALRRSMQGDLLRPGDAGYQQARLTYWAQFDAVTPQAVALCASPAGVAACLSFCQDHDLPAVPRSGGHSMGGYSTTDGLVIDVSRLAQVQVRRAEPTAALTAVVGPGARQVDALLELGRDGLAIPSGMCPTVRVGGFVSGGGFGWTTRRYGMASDQLVSAEVVLADGRVVRCSQTEEPDLFWALRGAGSGNFGVITEYELRPQRLTRLVDYLLVWPWDAAAAVISAWQRWIANGPDELGAALSVSLSDAAPGAAGQATVAAAGAWLGEAAALERHLDAFITDVGRPPLTRATQEQSYVDAMLKAYGVADTKPQQRHWVGHNPEATIPRQHYCVDRSRLIEQEIPSSGIEEIMAVFDGDRRAGQVRLLSCFALGGQVNRVPRTATAYVHRTAQYYLAYWVGLDRDQPDGEDRVAAEAWADEGFDVIDRYSGGESYQNFIDPRLESWQQAYYAENHPRLVAAKRRYDPHGFFRFAQAVG